MPPVTIYRPGLKVTVDALIVIPPQYVPELRVVVDDTDLFVYVQDEKIGAVT